MDKKKEKFWITLVELQATIHKLHLAAPTLNIHKALDIYNKWGSLVDAIIESNKTYGSFGENKVNWLHEGEDQSEFIAEETSDTFKNIRSYVIANKQDIWGDDCPPGLNACFDNLFQLIDAVIFEIQYDEYSNCYPEDNDEENIDDI